MRNWGGLAAAALVAAGCGGSGDVAVSDGARDEHSTPVLACEACKVAGAGTFDVGGMHGWFSFSAAPKAGTGGTAGAGVAATGWFEAHVEDACGGAGQAVSGEVDTVLHCSHVDGVPTATLSLADAGGRFTVTLKDGSLAPDAVTVGGGAVSLTSGEVRIQPFDRCAPECPVGECLCHETHGCVPCTTPPPPILTEPPPFGGGEPPIVTEPPVETPPPPVITPPPPPPGPFIPL